MRIGGAVVRCKAEGMRQAAYDFLKRDRRWVELLNHVARNGRQPGPGLKWRSRDHLHQISAGSALRWIIMVQVFRRGRSQYKCQGRHKQDTKSHHYNCDRVISGNLKHRETPKIADRPVGPRNGRRSLVKPTAISKTVQNCEFAKRSGGERRRGRQHMPSPRRSELIDRLRPSTHDSVLNPPSRKAFRDS
jgi:hypothetical protein